MLTVVEGFQTTDVQRLCIVSVHGKACCNGSSNKQTNKQTKRETDNQTIVISKQPSNQLTKKPTPIGKTLCLPSAALDLTSLTPLFTTSISSLRVSNFRTWPAPGLHKPAHWFWWMAVLVWLALWSRSFWISSSSSCSCSWSPIKSIPSFCLAFQPWASIASSTHRIPW